MDFQASNRLPGDDVTYAISPDIKEYTLIDLGFEKTRRGNYKYSGSLDRQSPFKPMARLLITINGELTGFKIDTVNTNGLAQIDIFKAKRHEEFETQLRFILNEMVDRGIFKQSKA